MLLRSLRAAVLVLAAQAFIQPLVAQLQPPSTGGLPALEQQLRLVGQYKRVLLIGAHPDDEDTELLTVLVRGMGAAAGYLSLNRGEGGQNLIGEELGEELGLLRSEELLAARQLDGAQQFFTRAYDFGFSKSLDDTWDHWPKDSVLKDVVRIVRRFRPQVIVSIFSGTPRDGHGQHQAAGWAASQAFEIAGDSTRFPELFTEEGFAPWTPLKLYRSARFDSAATTITLQGGTLDPAVGQSFHQIAMRGRSLHRSQDMGQLQHIGPSVIRLALIKDRTGKGTAGIFEGIDTTLAGTPDALTLKATDKANLARTLKSYNAKLAEARAAISPTEAAKVPALLISARADLSDAAKLIRQTGPEEDFEGETSRLSDAIARSSNLLVDAYSDDSSVVPGQEFRATASVWNAGPAAQAVDLCFVSPSLGWRLDVDSATSVAVPMAIHRGTCLGLGDSGWQPLNKGGGQLAPGTVASARLRVKVPDKWKPTTPYFLREPRDGDLYRWDPADRSSWGLPFETPPFKVEAQVPLGSDLGYLPREVVYRTNDQARGEVRSPVNVVSRIDVKLQPETELWPLGSGARKFVVTLTHGARDSTSGKLSLSVPQGWSAPPAQPFQFSREGERASFTFTVRPPQKLAAGSYELFAVAQDNAGNRYDGGSFTIAYSHIRPRTYYRQAKATVDVASLTLPPVAHIGYIRGAADRIPEALQTVGIKVELIDGKALDRIDLSGFRAIVVGPRAYETDPDLPGNNDNLLAFAKKGGLVVVQYQQYAFFLNDYAPYPLTVGSRAPGTTTVSTTQRGSPSVGGTALLGGHDRVTDETAEVTAVQPVSPVLLRPNRIGKSDWAGWVQERGLYFAHSWDAQYHPVLSMHDPGDPALEGGLLIAKVGTGTYVYTGLSFFRQLPAGVPGAFRLFANLLALAEVKAGSRAP
ncbi:MAG TPA: PIG-L family deacetylase [Gemmatimonadales bacterium]